ncbi:MAG: formyltransferase family protein [Mesorhizobium sp.]
MSGIVLTAGYDRAPHSIAVAEGLRRLGCPPTLILIAYPMTVARVRTILRSRGSGAILRYLRRRTDGTAGPSPLADHLAAADISEKSLRAWAKRWNVRCLSVGDINAAGALRLVKSAEPLVTIYTGGGILRRGFLDAAGRRVINAHSGPLPAVRGMNACEWSLLLGEPLSVTIHLIDEGIDTGAIIERIGVTAQPGDNVSVLRERCVVAGIDALVRHAHLMVQGRLHTREEEDPGPPQRQCFVLAPALRELLWRRLPDLVARQRHLAVKPEK